MQWSVDGQLIAASTNQGSIYVFVTKLSMLSSVSFDRVAILSSLAEVSLYTYNIDRIPKLMCTMPLDIEPSVIVIGPNNFACAINNHAWFYDLNHLSDNLPTLLNDREYIAEINTLQLNERFCAALINGRLFLHSVYVLLFYLYFDNASAEYKRKFLLISDY